MSSLEHHISGITHNTSNIAYSFVSQKNIIDTNRFVLQQFMTTVPKNTYQVFLDENNHINYTNASIKSKTYSIKNFTIKRATDTF